MAEICLSRRTFMMARYQATSKHTSIYETFQYSDINPILGPTCLPRCKAWPVDNRVFASIPTKTHSTENNNIFTSNITIVVERGVLRFLSGATKLFTLLAETPNNAIVPWPGLQESKIGLTLWVGGMVYILSLTFVNHSDTSQSCAPLNSSM